MQQGDPQLTSPTPTFSSAGSAIHVRQDGESTKEVVRGHQRVFTDRDPERWASVRITTEENHSFSYALASMEEMTVHFGEREDREGARVTRHNSARSNGGRRGQNGTTERNTPRTMARIRCETRPWRRALITTWTQAQNGVEWNVPRTSKMGWDQAKTFENFSSLPMRLHIQTYYDCATYDIPCLTRQVVQITDEGELQGFEPAEITLSEDQAPGLTGDERSEFSV